MSIVSKEYKIKKGDFNQAGDGSIQIKRILNSMGIDNDIVRRVAVCAYESEMNVVMHGGDGSLLLTVDSTGIVIEVKDNGPGIGDVDLALKEGYSTASNEYREMGFGAGMGLPNIMRNADTFEITSREGKGTNLTIGFQIK
ncbi:ATP-binding protein [Thermodesulfobacteriota bacterium]